MGFNLKIERAVSSYNVVIVVGDGASPLSTAGVARSLECLAACDLPFILNIQTVYQDQAISPHRTLNNWLDSLETTTSNPDVVFLVCNTIGRPKNVKPLRRLVRTCKRRGVAVAGIGAASWVFAEARLNSGSECVVHWASEFAFAEHYFDVEPTTNLFANQTNFATCAGEMATLDFMIEIISCNLGTDIARRVSHMLLVTHPRGQQARQPGALDNRLQHYPEKLKNIVADMKPGLENSFTIYQLSERHNISQRQLERLFSKYLNSSPRRYSRKLQLEAAYHLCEQSDLAPVEIAVVCGFGSSAHFSKCFRQEYGVSPIEMRDQNSRLRNSDCV